MQKFLQPVTVFLLFSLLGGPVAAEQRFIEGLFSATESGTPIELIAWAEGQRGVLKMAHGFLEDAPILPRTYRFLANVGGFAVVGVLAVNRDVFTTELDRLNSKMLPHSAVKLNIKTVEIGVPELEDWDKVLRLRKSMNATADKPLVLFIVLSNGVLRRYYPFFIDR
jgi:hypothetical protein